MHKILVRRQLSCILKSHDKFAFTCSRLASNSAETKVEKVDEIKDPRDNMRDAEESKLAHSSNLRYFFDIPENWFMDELPQKNRPGRAWTADELRLKSNDDLHHLWFILLRERNMLKTMRRECQRQFHRFPNPEREHKVEESMAALEEVVHERNVAYSLLETGRTGERPTKRITTFAGFHVDEPLSEHIEPPSAGDKQYETPELDDDQEMFAKLRDEFEWERKQRARDDLMRAKGEHREWYTHERQMSAWHEHHEDNMLDDDRKSISNAEKVQQS